MTVNVALERIRAAGVNTGITHVANSMAAMEFGSLGFDAVRVGSAILGKMPEKYGLEEAVWLESKVFSIYNRLEGEHIGYSGEAYLKRDSSLAVVRIGTGCGVGLIQKGAMDYTFGNFVKGGDITANKYTFKNLDKERNKKITGLCAL